MQTNVLPCLATPGTAGRPLYAVRPADLDRVMAELRPGQAEYLRQTDFSATGQQFALLAGENGLGGAIVGLSQDRSPFAFGGLPSLLPENTCWELQPGDFDQSDAVLGFCLGAYQFSAMKPASRQPARLILDSSAAVNRAIIQSEAIWMVRDLVNLPANILGPVELASEAEKLGRTHGADVRLVAGDELEREYPAVAVVGRGSARPARVVVFHWSGSRAAEHSPLISLCGKGVCFDTGGYDLKPSSGMLRMKKDMGGAATALGLARMIMQADLPVRLALRIGCVENSVSGTAMRPLDVIRTRSGILVEIGNTDAEGRLVLSDLLTEATSEHPTLLMDFATLTGAARVALGPDLPALFSNDDSWAVRLLESGMERHDPLWRLPLWNGYDSWLSSQVADVNNVSSKPMAGSIIAALFLQRFVAPLAPWAHFDIYAWNDQSQPGRPEGGEAQAIRGIFAALEQFSANSQADRNSTVTSS